MSPTPVAAQQAPWEFAGWGEATRIADLDPTPLPPSAPRHKLGTWAATAICGNDITSSCLYVSALCAAQAGVWAPVSLAVVALVLYFFRKIYAEVGSALPLNGGTYTVLLNTTNKKFAAAAACLTLLSYIATAVISASEALHYAHALVPVIPVFAGTVALLGIFALLNIIGITESAVVAIGIFAFHMLSLTVLVLSASVAVASNPALLLENLSMPDPRGLGPALFFGFAAGMLGISGFESSANFIEEQKEGVFPKTLRNMWLAVAIFNPTISFLSLGLVPMAVLASAPTDLLAQMGQTALGSWFRVWICIDAVLVLSGAVLTSFVGVTGLIRRMSLDRCLPELLLKQNRWRGTNHRIIIAFFLLCVSILAATGGVVSTLAGVYALSFLCVMALFAVGNMLLKLTRGRLPRAVRASVPGLIFAFAAVVVALMGNLMLDPSSVQVFAAYFAVAVLVVAAMFARLVLLRLVLYSVGRVVTAVVDVNQVIQKVVLQKANEIGGEAVIYFTKGDAPAQLNAAALYVQANEQTHRLIVVHVYDHEEHIPSGLAGHLSTIDKLYPALRIDFVAVRGTFGPALVQEIGTRLGIASNCMFIGTPGDAFPHRIEELGGVRVIL